MVRRVLVQKKEFDSALSTLLSAKPVPRKKIKVKKHHTPTPILSKP